MITYWHTLSSFDKLNSFLKYKNKLVRNYLKLFKVVKINFTASLLITIHDNYLILDARFGPRRRGMVLSVSPGISPSPFFTIATERTES